MKLRGLRGDGKLGFSDQPVLLTASRTFTDLDNGQTLTYFGSTEITLTLPAGLAPGFKCNIVQMGTGQVAIIGVTG